MTTGPVYIVDDDIDDHEMIKEIWVDLKLTQELQIFSTAKQLLDHMENSDAIPWIIITDVNLPKMDGFELCGGQPMEWILCSQSWQSDIGPDGQPCT